MEALTERVRALDRYQKAILCILTLMVLGFAVLYFTTVSRVGYAYQDALLVPTEEGGNTVYSGEIDGMPSSFTVTPDKTVTFQYGVTTYGPYTVIEDETAVPKGRDGKGVEVRLGDEIIFRGCYYEKADYWYLNPESEAYSSTSSYIEVVGGVVYDKDGNIIDPNEPSAGTLVHLAFGPELAHKGSLWIWFLGVVLCVMSAISILFADELFRWTLSFRVRYAYDAEPSDWEISSRYIGWTLEPIFALIIFIVGLQ